MDNIAENKILSEPKSSLIPHGETLSVGELGILERDF
jgi:hypothetical protein